MTNNVEKVEKQWLLKILMAVLGLLQLGIFAWAKIITVKTFDTSEKVAVQQADIGNFKSQLDGIERKIDDQGKDIKKLLWRR